MKCSKHPKYKGEEKPEYKCLDCWKIWLYENESLNIEAKELLDILICLENTKMNL